MRWELVRVELCLLLELVVMVMSQSHQAAAVVVMRVGIEVAAN